MNGYILSNLEMIVNFKFNKKYLIVDVIIKYSLHQLIHVGQFVMLPAVTEHVGVQGKTLNIGQGDSFKVVLSVVGRWLMGTINVWVLALLVVEEWNIQHQGDLLGMN